MLNPPPLVDPILNPPVVGALGVIDAPKPPGVACEPKPLVAGAGAVWEPKPPPKPPAGAGAGVTPPKPPPKPPVLGVGMVDMAPPKPGVPNAGGAAGVAFDVPKLNETGAAAGAEDPNDTAGAGAGANELGPPNGLLLPDPFCC